MEMSYRIIRNPAKGLYRISFLRIILRDISVPTAHFIRSLEIRHLSNPTFAYKLDPFITDYTQVSRDALQNRKIAYNSIPFATDYTQSCEDAPQIHIFAYKVEDISVPTALFIRSLEIRHPSNPTFAYKLDPFITDYTQVSRDALQNRKIAYNSIPFATDYTQSCEDAPQNHIFAYKIRGVSVPLPHFQT